MREIKFEVCIRRKDGTDLRCETLTVDDLLDRNGCLYNPNLEEIVYKRQFTGLKDKNGKEIYEGDIVKKCYGSSVPIFAIAYSEARGMYISQDGYNEPLFHTPLNQCEVIGNIYENGDLLK